MQQIVDAVQQFSVLIFFVLIGVIAYQQRKITRLEAQVDLLVDLTTDEADDPNARGAVITKLKQLRHAHNH